MRLRNFGTWAILAGPILLGLSLPAMAAERPGAISGYVRNISGDPQMGAVVEILGAANRTLTVFTDGAGYYSANGLLPGLYTLKVTRSIFPARVAREGRHPPRRQHQRQRHAEHVAGRDATWPHPHRSRR